MRDNVEKAAHKGRLVKTADLKHSLGERLYTSGVDIVLESAEKEVQVESLFRRGDQVRVQEGFVECAVETVVGQASGGGQMLDEKKGLDAGIEVGRVGNLEQSIKMLLHAVNY